MAKKTKKRIKIVLPTLKEKKRYLAFEILSKNKIKLVAGLPKVFLQSVKNLVGEIGAAGMGFIFLKELYSVDSQKGIIRINHNYTNELKSSLALIKEIESQQVIVRSVGLSGVLKKSKEKYLKEGEK